MNAVIGSIVGIILFVGVVVSGLVNELPHEQILTRALVCLLAGFIAGTLVFGTIGSQIVRDSLKREEKDQGKS